MLKICFKIQNNRKKTLKNAPKICCQSLNYIILKILKINKQEQIILGGVDDSSTPSLVVPFKICNKSEQIFSKIFFLNY